MQKQIQKVNSSIKKVEEGLKEVMEDNKGKYNKTGKYIVKLLYKRERILQKTKRKLLAINRENFINWEQ